MRKLFPVLQFCFIAMLTCFSLPSPAVSVNGVDLDVVVSGQGDTLVLFESGFGRGPEVWDSLVAHLPNNIVAVRYARAGSGKSADRGTPSSIEQHLKDLTTLLHQLGSGKKLVLVGHSYGGLLVTEFARRHRDKVSGLLLIDPTVAQQRLWFKAANANAVADEDALLTKILPAPLQAQLRQLNTELDAAGHQVLPLPSDLKTILLTSTRVEAEPMVFVETASGKALWLKLHQALFAEVKNGNHMRLNTVGHNIMQDAPDTVLNALHALL